MLFGITGTPCSGKSMLETYLVEHCGFIVLDAHHVRITNPRDMNNDQPEENTELCNQENTWDQLTTKEIIEWVTPRWKTNYVLPDVHLLDSLDILRKRPFFLLIAMDAPVSKRFQFALEQISGDKPRILEKFIHWNDTFVYEGKDLRTQIQYPLTIHECMENANVLFMNTSKSAAELITQWTQLDITNAERVRPSWDSYFMLLAELASRRSNCMKRRVGAMLVKNNTIMATGYNGTPRNTRNCNEGGCLRCNSNTACGRQLDQCLCLHAEENALLEAGRERSTDAVLYCNTCPCLGCAKKIVQAGVRAVIYASSYAMDDLSQQLFTEAGILFKQHCLLTSRCFQNSKEVSTYQRDHPYIE